MVRKVISSNIWFLLSIIYIQNTITLHCNSKPWGKHFHWKKTSEGAGADMVLSLYDIGNNTLKWKRNTRQKRNCYSFFALVPQNIKELWPYECKLSVEEFDIPKIKCCCRYRFLKKLYVLNISSKTPVLESLFKLTLPRKRLRHSFFSVNVAKFLRAPIV